MVSTIGLGKKKCRKDGGVHGTRLANFFRSILGHGYRAGASMSTVITCGKDSQLCEELTAVGGAEVLLRRARMLQ